MGPADGGEATWPKAVGGVAVGLVLLVVVVVATLGLPGAGNGTGEGVDGNGVDGMATDAPTVERAEKPATGSEAPVVLASDRDLGEGDVASLLDVPALEALARRDLDAAEGASLAERFTGALVGDAPDTPRAGRAEEHADGEESADGGTPSSATRPLDATARADLGRCLETVLADARAPIPAYVEVARYQGESAIMFGLLGRGADGERYERLEVWVLERADCQVRTFQQRDE